MFKILLQNNKSYAHQSKEIGLKIVKFYSKRENFKSELKFTFNIGYQEYGLILLWGKCKLFPEFTNLNWKQGDTIECFNDEETILLRLNQHYTVREIRWVNGGDGYLYPKVSLMEFKPQFDYEATRFLPQPEESYE